MKLGALRTEVQARGFDYVPSSRVNTLVNYVYHDVNGRQAWPYLETTTSGTAPLTISDFGRALSVVNTTSEYPLQYEDIRTLREADPALSAAGGPEYWYMDGDDLTVYPANTSDIISVRYLKVAPELSDDEDTPLIPSRFRYTLVEGVVAKLYRDDDEYESALSAQEAFENGVIRMTEELLVVNFDSALSLPPTWGSGSDW